MSYRFQNMVKCIYAFTYINLVINFFAIIESVYWAFHCLSEEIQESKGFFASLLCSDMSDHGIQIKTSNNNSKYQLQNEIFIIIIENGGIFVQEKSMEGTKFEKIINVI